MKAILITFTGSYKPGIPESSLNEFFVRTIAERTDNVEEINITHLSDIDVAKTILRGTLSRVKSESKNSDFENELIEYCKTVLNKAGIDPRDQEDSKNKFLFIKSFFIFPELRQPKRVLNWLKNCENPTPKCQNILGLHGLANLPEWLKEITTITNIL